MRRGERFQTARLVALLACVASGACTYDFDGLVAETGGAGASGGAGGAGGSSGAAGTPDGGEDDGSGTGGSAGSGGTMDAGQGGTSGSGGSDGGKGGTGGTTADAGKGGSAGATDAAADRSDATGDRADARDAAAFDCAAVSGVVFQGHCYYPSPTPTTWDTARTTSCAAPSHLAVIRSVGEQNVVAQILPGAERWIGLGRPAGAPNAEGSFRWVTNESVSYRLWETYDTGAPEPNYTGDCVRMRASNSWADTGCNEMYAAVCERE
jgi:hypothetical protein